MAQIVLAVKYHQPPLWHRLRVRSADLPPAHTVLLPFAVQAGIGGILAYWQPDAGAPAPAGAYGVAFGGLIAVQAVALVWLFAGPRARALTNTEGALQ